MVDRGASLEIEVRDDPTQYRITLRGELDIDGADRVNEALARADQDETTWILVDLSELQFIDSTGIQSLLLAQRSAMQNGHRLSFTPGGPQVERVMRLCGLDTQLEFVEDGKADGAR